MTQILLDQPVAAAWGVFGMLCLMTWPLFKQRSTMLIVQLGIGVGLGLHYALLGAPTAATMNAFSAAQVLAAIGMERRPNLRWVYWAIIPLIAVASVVTWTGPQSALAALGMAFITAGRMQSNVLSLRLLILCAQPFWFAHDVMVGSLPAMIADAGSLTIGTAMLLRYHPPRWLAHLRPLLPAPTAAAR